MSKLKEIEARWEGLGPWGPTTFGYNNGGCPSVFLKTPGREDDHTIEVREQEGEAIAHAPEDVQYLLSEVRRLMVEGSHMEARLANHLEKAAARIAQLEMALRALVEADRDVMCGPIDGGMQPRFDAFIEAVEQGRLLVGPKR